MKVFKDSQDREWTVAINIAQAIKLKSKLSVDILQPEQGNPPLLERLGTDEIFLANVIAVLLDGQFVRYEMDETKILEAFDGETLVAAQTAFYEELVDFFRSRGRTDREKAVLKMIEAVKTGIRLVEAKVEGIDIEAEVSGAISGESPEPSESTPTH